MKLSNFFQNIAKTVCNRYFAHSAMPLIQNLDPKTASNIQARNLLLFFLGSKLLRPFWCNMYLSRWGGNHYMFFFTLPLFICIDLCYLNLFLIFRIEVASTLFLMDVSLRCNMYVSESMSGNHCIDLSYLNWCNQIRNPTSSSKSCKSCDRSRFIQSGLY